MCEVQSCCYRISEEQARESEREKEAAAPSRSTMSACPRGLIRTDEPRPRRVARGDRRVIAPQDSLAVRLLPVGSRERQHDAASAACFQSYRAASTTIRATSCGSRRRPSRQQGVREEEQAWPAPANAESPGGREQGRSWERSSTTRLISNHREKKGKKP